MDMKRYASLDMSDLFDRRDSKSVRNFYLSGKDFGEKLLGGLTSFTFNGFFISICLGGRCELKVSGRSYTIEAGSLMIFSPNQLIEIQSSSPDLDWKSIIVSLDVILEFPSPVDIDIMTSALRNPVLHVGEDGTRHLMEYYLFIEKRYSETSSAYREEISKTLLYALMLEICNIFRNVSDEDSDIAKPRQEKLTDDFFKLMAKHYRTEHNVAFYAAKLHRTPKYLSGAIRRISGRSVAEWINSTLVSEIKMLLKTTDKTVLEISEELNFSSPSVMVQFFRHYTGITPLRYRKS
ncbi:MAG TPA: helix-turn-helix transcriptional regulator [Candidatus Cryptobacteroides merdipullorum]|uniref:Helix-turn-helix transcriptional regulator n=1 Tax=Candidatus Cryptobacteroides merdipullorum TaxID=2840771 RepID=A0A9D1GMN5_9BACT|nr:helix-turn-helix transcriptional regulator [Candidatus Cryptobacteroides merdipullorum]